MRIPKQVSLTKSIALTISLVLLVSGIVYVLAATPSSTFWLMPGVYPGAPSFTVWREGNNYFAKNANGEIEFSGTNFTQVVQDAHDSLGATGGSIFITNGNYTYDVPILVSSNTITIEGENQHYTFLHGRGCSDYALQITGWGCSIRNLEVKGGLMVNTTASITLRDLYIDGASGRWALYVQDSHDSIVDGCRVTQGVAGQLGGMLMRGINDDVSDWRITNCIFDNCDNYLMKLQGDYAANEMIRDCMIIGNFFHIGATYIGHGIELVNTLYVKLEGNTIAGASNATSDLLRITGRTDIGYPTHDVKVIGNDFWAYTAGRYALWLNCSDNGMFVGNLFDGYTNDCVLVAGYARNNTFLSCRFPSYVVNPGYNNHFNLCWNGTTWIS